MLRSSRRSKRHRTVGQSPVAELAAELAHRSSEKAVAAPHYCAVRQFISEAQARSESPGIGVGEAPLPIAPRAVAQKCQRTRQTVGARVGNTGLELRTVVMRAGVLWLPLVT